MLIYDLEIKNCILQKGEEKDPNLQYCKGWGDHKGMGISVLVAYDYVEGRYRIFMDDNKDEFQALVNAGRKLIGYNQINFDDRVIEACWGISMPKDRSYDLLKAVWAAVTKREQNGKSMHKGYGLDAVSQANFGEKKSTSGANAPIWWQQGKIGAVIDYCLQDVNLTKKLFDLVVSSPSIIDPTDSEKRLSVRGPVWGAIEPFDG